MTKKIFFLKDKLIILFIFLLGFFLNNYFGSIGVFPIDTFSHFDMGYLVLNGYVPFKDYWTTTGSFIDFSQAFFFSILGVNWNAYIFNASFLNGVLSVSTYVLFRKLNLETATSVFYALCFSLLAYTISGTPFVDFHSLFFSLLAIYFFIFAILEKKKIYWICIPIFLCIAFFSKQTPAGYVIVLLSILILIYIIKNKYFKIFKYLFISNFFLFLIILFFFLFHKINLTDFFVQFFLFPGQIAKQRLYEIDLSFKSLILQFKFIHITFLVYFFSAIKNFKDKNLYIFISLFILYLSSIFHQLITKNQVFINFLTIIFLAISHSEIKNFIFNNSLYKKTLIVIILFFCLFLTSKYHVRYNTHRYFMDLQNIELKNFVKGSMLDEKLSGIRWINPFNNFSELEVKELVTIKNILKNEKKPVMLMTNYQFFSSLNDKIYFQPNRWYTSDGVSYPIKNSKYFLEYKKFLKKKIIFNKIYVIYIVDDAFPLYDFFEKNCFEVERATTLMYKFTVKSCEDFS